MNSNPIGYCPHCSKTFKIAFHLGARVATAGIASAFGAAATKDPLTTLLIGGLSYLFASAVDDYVSKKCPECGAILEMVPVPA